MTLIDTALRWPERHLEAAVNQADALDLLDPEAMRSALDRFVGQPGVRPLRALLDGHTFRLTDSELERIFLRLIRRVGLTDPETQRYANSWRVDFLWPDLGLVVETDSLRYHRTPGPAGPRLQARPGPPAGRPVPPALHALPAGARATPRASSPPARHRGSLGTTAHAFGRPGRPKRMNGDQERPS